MLMLHVATIMIDQRFCYESLSVKSKNHQKKWTNGDVVNESL